ncbi:MAG TPA: hypothetical protein VMV43_11970 [Candidatus Nanopelagicaceae bacterium]|jgi:hypothetical protein|nr:hypothetical protein [Candidatus Nanopelagicaceae bacterium]
MSEKLKEFLKKIHDPKNNLPIYATIIVRPGKKIVDIKIKKEEANILRVLAHEEKSAGWFIHSFHIPIKNIGLTPDAKNKEILANLSNPINIPIKSTKTFVEDILRKYINILPDKKKHYFVTERYKKKKEMQTGVKLKGF